MNDNVRAVVEFLDRAQAKLKQGDGTGHLAALDGALALEPYCFPAMLMKGAYFEARGKRRTAAKYYQQASKIAPPDDELSQSLAQRMRHAREVVSHDATEFQAFLNKQVSTVREQHKFAKLDRFDHCLDAFAGKTKVYVNEASVLLFPQLPAIEFFDNADFPWLKELAQKTPNIITEFKTAINASQTDFKPYIDAPPGTPLNQWEELNRSPKWSTFYFWREGVRQTENCRRYPQTVAACDAAPMAVVPEYAPTAMYSCLSAGGRIPPHTGVTNTRLVLHLPLIVPPDCGYRVGHDVREWRVGVPWIFDDTIEHEAWNNSDQLRSVLIFDIWNPLLSQAERDLVCALLAASRRYVSAEA